MSGVVGLLVGLLILALWLAAIAVTFSISWQRNRWRETPARFVVAALATCFWFYTWIWWAYLWFQGVKLGTGDRR